RLARGAKWGGFAGEASMDEAGAAVAAAARWPTRCAKATPASPTPHSLKNQRRVRYLECSALASVVRVMRAMVSLLRDGFVQVENCARDDGERGPVGQGGAGWRRRVGRKKCG